MLSYIYPAIFFLRLLSNFFGGNVQMETVCENMVTIDFKQAKMVATIGESWHSFLPAIRSGDWSDIGGRDYM
jgi:protein phosphatase 2C family protein 2/3